MSVCVLSPLLEHPPTQNDLVTLDTPIPYVAHTVLVNPAPRSPLTPGQPDYLSTHPTIYPSIHPSTRHKFQMKGCGERGRPHCMNLA